VAKPIKEIGTCMPRRIIWNGTTDEALGLLQALRAHCSCTLESGRMITPCTGHVMLACDQRALDGLLFMRRKAARLLAEESAVAPPSPVSAITLGS
jgi:hypothetical protein